MLFIDARKLGHLVDRTRKEFSDEDITRIASAYHAWRGEKDAGAYEDVAGFCRAATLDEIKSRNYVLTPGGYVGATDAEDDAEPFEVRFAALRLKLHDQFAESTGFQRKIERLLGAVDAR